MIKLNKILVYKILMTGFIPDEIQQQIEELKNLDKLDEALRIVNSFLVENPDNEDALLQIADIHFRKGNIQGALKAIDFFNKNKSYSDPLGLYIKGILEMEKNNWELAREVLQKAVELTQWDNFEILRAYGLSEYWYGNREKGINLLYEAFNLQPYDAETITNLIEILLIEKDFKEAKKLIKLFLSNPEKFQTIDKKPDYYITKIQLFQKMIELENFLVDEK